MPNSAVFHTAILTDDQIDRLLNQMADSFGEQLRSPVLHSPSEEKLDYEDVTFPSLDGIPLEGCSFRHLAPTRSSLPIIRWGSAGQEFQLISNRGDRFGRRAVTTSR
jgi:hypothetical protein